MYVDYHHRLSSRTIAVLVGEESNAGRLARAWSWSKSAGHVCRGEAGHFIGFHVEVASLLIGAGQGVHDCMEAGSWPWELHPAARMATARSWPGAPDRAWLSAGANVSRPSALRGPAGQGRAGPSRPKRILALEGAGKSARAQRGATGCSQHGRGSIPTKPDGPREAEAGPVNGSSSDFFFASYLLHRSIFS
jgi:hypothetical protein